jgi:hypothetical protein
MLSYTPEPETLADGKQPPEIYVLENICCSSIAYFLLVVVGIKQYKTLWNYTLGGNAKEVDPLYTQD